VSGARTGEQLCEIPLRPHNAARLLPRFRRAPLCESDHAVRQSSQLLGLGHRRADALVVDERGHLRTRQDHGHGQIRRRW